MISSKLFFQVTSLLFALVGFLHIVRVLTGFSLVYAGVYVPVWLSFIAGLFLWCLSYSAYKLSKKKRR